MIVRFKDAPPAEVELPLNKNGFPVKAGWTFMGLMDGTWHAVPTPSVPAAKAAKKAA